MIGFNYISFNEIRELKISPEECVAWAEHVIRNKRNWELPPKISIHFGNECFFNTMPSLIPELDLFGLKMVSRLLERSPALKADIFLYSAKTGNMICAMDGTWITTMRTGAVAAITAKHLQKSGNREYSFVGLGNTARASLLCLDAILSHEEINVKLLAYKDQHELFMERFKDFKNINFEIFHDTDEFMCGSTVIFSCVTAATSLFSDDRNYKKGVLIIPVQTRGFQNCDLVFDRIYCDDIPHIAGFKNFSLYKNVAEMTDVLNKSGCGRLNDRERLIAYNIGISLQDVYFANKVYKRFGEVKKERVEELPKFWV